MFEILAINAAPFEFNNLLGPLMALGAFAGAAKIFLAMGALRHHLQKEEATFREGHLPHRD